MEDTEIVRLAPVQQRAYKEYLNWLRDVHPSGVVRNALFRYYEDDFDDYVYKIEVSGKEYPFTVFTKPEWVNLKGSLDEYIHSTKSTEKTSHRPKRIKRLAREMYMRQHAPSEEMIEFPIKKLLWNGDSLCISNQAGKAEFQLEHTDFFSYASTGESMLRELYDALWEENVTSADDEEGIGRAIGQLDQRDKVASKFTDYISWPDHFHKAGPVCQLVIKLPDGTHEAYYTKRSHYVLQAPDTFSVTPAGELQADEASNASMNEKAIEELGEELLGVPDEMTGAGGRGKMKQEVTTSKVTDAVNDGKIHLRRTAFGFDMNAVKPIFAGLVYVEDPELGQWMRGQMETNWEAAQLRSIDLPRQSVPKELHPDVASSSGALAFYEGMRTLEREFDVDTGLDFTLALR